MKKAEYILTAILIWAVFTSLSLVSFKAYAEEINPYQTIEISDDEYKELRWVVALETRNSYEDKKAVCATILNRVLSDNFPDTVHGVLSQKTMFSTYKLIGSKEAYNRPGEKEDDAISEVLRGGIDVTALTSYRYVYFDYPHDKWGKNHITISNGNQFGEE